MDPYRVFRSLRSPTARSRRAETMLILGFAERLGKSKAIVAAPADCRISDHQSAVEGLQTSGFDFRVGGLFVFQPAGCVGHFTRSCNKII